MSFIDNVIIRIESKEGYDEIVKEVVKKLVENCCSNYLPEWHS